MVIGKNIVGKITDPLITVEALKKTTSIFSQGSYLNEGPYLHIPHLTGTTADIDCFE